MNEKALRVLEYPKIIAQLTECATSPSGKAQCRTLQPSDSLPEIIRTQRETSDALRRIYAKGSLSFSGVKDIRPDIRRLEIGSSLGIPELLDIAKLLDAALRAHQYEKPEKSTGEEDLMEDSLTDLFRGIEPLQSLNREIRRCILSEDEIADDASSELRRIRRQISLNQERIHSQLTQIVNGPARQYLQDALITQRDGRYCIPVRAEHRSQVPGMIHDQSATGSTLFVEPMAIVKLNNDIRQLEADEKAEIQKILSALSEEAAQSSEMLITDV